MEKSNLNNLMEKIQKDRDEMAFSEIFDFLTQTMAVKYVLRMSMVTILLKTQNQL